MNWLAMQLRFCELAVSQLCSSFAEVAVQLVDTCVPVAQNSIQLASFIQQLAVPMFCSCTNFLLVGFLHTVQLHKLPAQLATSLLLVGCPYVLHLHMILQLFCKLYQMCAMLCAMHWLISQLVFRDLSGQLHKILLSWLRPYSTWLSICSAVAAVVLVSWLTVFVCNALADFVVGVQRFKWLVAQNSPQLAASIQYLAVHMLCSCSSCFGQLAHCFCTRWLSILCSVAQVACSVGCITFTKLAIHMLYTCASCSTQLVLLSCICYTLLLVGCSPLCCVQLGTLVCTILAPMLANFPI